MPFAPALDGARLYYEEHGSGEPLVLIAGQAHDHHMWDPIRDDPRFKHLIAETSP